MMGFNIGIIGLGLMGGSMAQALRGFKNCFITGMDADSAIREKALASGAVDAVFEDAAHAVENADLTIFCTYPGSIRRYLVSLSGSFKDGSVVTEICGLKSAICQLASLVIPKGVDYIGIHPMAGKEKDGFDNADKMIFVNSGFIITPINTTLPSSITLIKNMAEYIGAARIAVSEPAEHDSIIGYTSDLMHISAAALCMNYPENFNPAHTAGAFRDCTRIALINAPLWTELLSDNRDFLLPHLDKYIENLTAVRESIASGNHDELFNLLKRASENKDKLSSI